MMIILKTKRLILRAWQGDDAEALYECAKNPLIGPAAGWRVHTSVNYSRQIICDYFNDDEIYAVVCPNITDKPIGCIGLKRGKDSTLIENENEAEIGYWLKHDFWRRGIMTEAAMRVLEHAFADLKLSKVWGGYYNDNIASFRVQKKCGMIYQYSKEVYLPLLDENRTEHVLCITAEQWYKQRLHHI